MDRTEGRRLVVAFPHDPQTPAARFSELGGIIELGDEALLEPRVEVAPDERHHGRERRALHAGAVGISVAETARAGIPEYVLHVGGDTFPFHAKLGLARSGQRTFKVGRQGEVRVEFAEEQGGKVGGGERRIVDLRDERLALARPAMKACRCIAEVRKGPLEILLQRGQDVLQE